MTHRMSYGDENGGDRGGELEGVRLRIGPRGDWKSRNEQKANEAEDER